MTDEISLALHDTGPHGLRQSRIPESLDLLTVNGKNFSRAKDNIKSNKKNYVKKLITHYDLQRSLAIITNVTTITTIRGHR